MKLERETRMTITVLARHGQSGRAIARMLGHLQVLLEGMAVQPAARLVDLPLLTEAERAQLGAWNDTAAEYPHDCCLHHLVEAQAARTPDTIARPSSRAMVPCTRTRATPVQAR